MTSDVPMSRAGMVALVGRPNVGKSTLLNTILGQKVTIATPKPQTTRTQIRGIFNRPGAQVVFVDTPGICAPRSPLHRAMRRIANSAAVDAEVGLLICDAPGDVPRIAPEDRELFESIHRGQGQAIVAINKVDRIKPKEKLLPFMAAYHEAFAGARVIPISARTGDGVDELLDALVAALPEGEPIFPADYFTDAPERFLCEELVREQILMQLQQEIPHRAVVVIESFEDGRDVEGGMCHIEGRVYVERKSQKGIVVGKGGARIKEISRRAREEMQELLGCQVFLRMTVAVADDWTQDPRALRRFGLDGGSEGPQGGDSR